MTTVAALGGLVLPLFTLRTGLRVGSCGATADTAVTGGVYWTGLERATIIFTTFFRWFTFVLLAFLLRNWDVPPLFYTIYAGHLDCRNLPV